MGGKDGYLGLDEPACLVPSMVQGCANWESMGVSHGMVEWLWVPDGCGEPCDYRRLLGDPIVVREHSRSSCSCCRPKWALVDHRNWHLSKSFLLLQLDFLLRTSADNAIDGADRGNVVFSAGTLLEKPIAYLPGKYARVLSLVFLNPCNHLRCCNLWLTPPNDARFD